jgi:type IV secretory pathway VirB10-like protein
MAPMTPPPETETPVYDFTPGDLAPIDTGKSKARFSKFKLPDASKHPWLKVLFRPILFSALGIHAFLLFVPLTTPKQAKPKELAEPVKLKRLSDKVLVKSMPKVKVTTAPKKPDLPKVAVAPSNPIVVKSEPEKPKPEEKKSEEKKPEDKKTDSKVADGRVNNKGEDPSKVDPKKATTDEKNASQLDAESQKVAGVIASLRSTLNPGEAEAEADSGLIDDPTPFFNVTPPPQGNSLISNQDVDTVEAHLKTQFTEKFVKKSDYGGGPLYETKMGNTVRYISLIKTNSGQGVMVFLWEKSPI